MIHDSGTKKGRSGRMRRRFPGARVVVFGHSHIPWLADEDGLMLLNPGSPTARRGARAHRPWRGDEGGRMRLSPGSPADRRRVPDHTFALLHVEAGGIRAEVLVL